MTTNTNTITIRCCRCAALGRIRPPGLKEVAADQDGSWMQRDIKHHRFDKSLARDQVGHMRLCGGDDPSTMKTLLLCYCKDPAIRAGAKTALTHMDAPRKAHWNNPPQVRAPSGKTVHCHACGHKAVINLKRTYMRAARAMGSGRDWIPCCNEPLA